MKRAKKIQLNNSDSDISGWLQKEEISSQNAFKKSDFIVS